VADATPSDKKVEEMGLSVEDFDRDILRLNNDRASIVGRSHKADVPLSQQEQSRIDSIDAQLRSLKMNRHIAAKRACAEGGWVAVIAEWQRAPESRWRITYIDGSTEEGEITHVQPGPPEEWEDSALFHFDDGTGSPGEPGGPRKVARVRMIELLFAEAP
jgi:hypothetical protein